MSKLSLLVQRIFQLHNLRRSSETLSYRHWACTSAALELAAEVGVVRKAHELRDIEDAHIGFREQPHGFGQPNLIHVLAHRPAARPLEEAAESGPVHGSVPRQVGVVDRIARVLSQVQADSVHPSLIGDPHQRLQASAGQRNTFVIEREIEQQRQQRDSSARSFKLQQSGHLPPNAMVWPAGKVQPAARGGEEFSKRLHLVPLQKVPAKDRRRKLDDDRALTVLSSPAIGFARRPGMRQVGTKQDQVSRPVVADAVAYHALSGSFFNQRQFEFGMVVPIERKRAARPPVYKQTEPGGGNLFVLRPHARSISNLRLVKLTPIFMANQVHKLLNRAEAAPARRDYAWSRGKETHHAATDC